MITLNCKCGKVFITKERKDRPGRPRFCSKICSLKFKQRRSGLKYKIVVQNKGWIKKGDKPWNKGIFEEKSSGWKGDNIGYEGIHGWVERQLGKKRECDFCGSKEAKKYDWSNKDHLYKRNITDWQRLCVSCHFKYDKKQFGTRESFHK